MLFDKTKSIKWNVVHALLLLLNWLKLLHATVVSSNITNAFNTLIYSLTQSQNALQKLESASTTTLLVTAGRAFRSV